jgi:hypothetical protein
MGIREIVKTWDAQNFLDPATAKLLGDSRFKYVPFHQLSQHDQYQVRHNRYPHKSEGRWGGFADEHYYYPVNKKGQLAVARRTLAISHKALNDEYMSTLGYVPYEPPTVALPPGTTEG